MNELHQLYKHQTVKSRSITAENPTGGKGMGGMAEIKANDQIHPARELGKGWKVRPYIEIEPGESAVIADIQDMGIVKHIWMTAHPTSYRHLIIKMFWDGEENPSVWVPFGDFFCNGWCERKNVHAVPISVNPAGGFNCYFPMPFREGAKMIIENIGFEKQIFFYQIDYHLTLVEEDATCFHASFRRENPVSYMKPFTILEGVKGKGQYVGTYVAWQVNSNDWWGEGEVKMYLDGDDEYPTICGTGTEDYFGGAWNFEHPKGRYGEFSNLYHGLQVTGADGLYKANQRFGMYRFHVPDPIYFEEDIRITMQALGWRSHQRFLPLQDDIACVAFWYQTEPHNPLLSPGDRNTLEVI